MTNIFTENHIATRGNVIFFWQSAQYFINLGKIRKG